MRADAKWARLGWPLVLAVTLAAGGAGAQETDPFVGAEGSVDEGVVLTDEEAGLWGPGEAAEGEMVVTTVEDSEPLPPGFCSGCAEDGEVVLEVAGASGGPAAPGLDGYDNDRRQPLVMSRARTNGPVNICTSAEYYVAWLCEWQGYPRP